MELLNHTEGRAVAQEVRRRPLTTEVRLQTRPVYVVFVVGTVIVVQISIPRISVFHCQYHQTGAPCSVIHLPSTLYDLIN